MIEQFGMRRSSPRCAEIVDGLDQAAAKQVRPDPIDHNPRC